MLMPEELLAAYREVTGRSPSCGAVILSIAEEKKLRYLATKKTDIKYSRDPSVLVAEDVIVDLGGLLDKGVPQPKAAWLGLSPDYVNVFVSSYPDTLFSNAVQFDDGRQIIGLNLCFTYPTCSSRKDIDYDVSILPLYKPK